MAATSRSSSSGEEGRPAIPGMVLDAGDLDAKLIILRVNGAPHFTGGDLDAIHKHFGKSLEELTPAEGQIAGAYVYLRRAGVDGASWDMARDQVAIEAEPEPDPTNGERSETSPSSAATGGAPRETLTS